MIPPPHNNDDFIIGTDLIEGYEEEDAIFADEVEVINADRLILIKIFTSLVKLSTDAFSKKQINNQMGDVNLQFHTLNMLDNLFANLLPVPNLLNIFMRHYN